MFCFFFFNDTATTEIYTLSLHDALPISPPTSSTRSTSGRGASPGGRSSSPRWGSDDALHPLCLAQGGDRGGEAARDPDGQAGNRAHVAGRRPADHADAPDPPRVDGRRRPPPPKPPPAAVPAQAGVEADPAGAPHAAAAEAGDRDRHRPSSAHRRGG